MPLLLEKANQRRNKLFAGPGKPQLLQCLEFVLDTLSFPDGQFEFLDEWFSLGLFQDGTGLRPLRRHP